jgi:hypothetical protein
VEIERERESYMKEQRARERKRGRSRRQERKNEKKNFFLFFPFFLSDTFVACVMEASIPWFLIWLAAGLDTQIFVSLLCLWSACRTLLYYTFDSIYPIGLSLSLSLSSSTFAGIRPLIAGAWQYKKKGR